MLLLKTNNSIIPYIEILLLFNVILIIMINHCLETFLNNEKYTLNYSVS